jgi:hypothetical protein
MKSLAHLADRQAIRRRLLALAEADQGLWGVLTAGEVVCHLRGAFRMAMSDAAVVYEKRPIPPKVMKAIALYAPAPWPKNFPTIPSLKIGTPVMQTGRFAADQASLLEAYDGFCEVSSHTHDHAYFHAMTHADWMRWGYLHTDHHLRQFGR